MDEIKETNDLKDLPTIIEDRIKDYNLAIEYFKQNDLNIQLKKAEEDLNKLLEYQKKIAEEGITSEIDEEKIPKEITPEYICGYSHEERIKKFHQIISEMINQKKKIQLELENKIKELKKLSKSQLLSIKDEIEKDFESIKESKDKYNQILNLLKEEFQNEWVPAPLFNESLEDTKFEIINEDIPENTLRVTMGKTDYIKDRIIFITTKITDYPYENIVNQKDKGDWSNVIDFKMEEKEYQELSEKSFYFDINEKIKNKNKYKGKCEVKLSPLKEKNDFSGKYPLDLETKRFVPTLELSFKIRKCKIPIYETKTKRVYCFTKFYPSFR